MKELNLARWTKDIPQTPPEMAKVLRTMPPSGLLPSCSTPCTLQRNLKGCVNPKKIFNLAALTNYYCIPDLAKLTMKYLANNPYQSDPNPATVAARLIVAPLVAFYTLHVPVLTFDNSGYILHNLRSTGPELFQKKRAKT